MQTFIRSFVFQIFLYLWTLFVGSFVIISVCLPSIITVFLSKLWARGVLFLLYIITGISCVVKGEQYISDFPVIFASKHQSTLETIFFYAYLPRVSYVLKKELLFIPFFGLALWKTGQIAIRRSQGRQALRLISSSASYVMRKLGASVVIFPEGTRTPYHVRVSQYKSGVYSLASTLGEQVVPVALNTGRFWPKGSFCKQKGKVVIQFLKPMSVSDYSSKEAFMSHLNSVIEKTSLSL